MLTSKQLEIFLRQVKPKGWCKMYDPYQTRILLELMRKFVADPAMESLEPITLACENLGCPGCPYSIQGVRWCIYDNEGREDNWGKRMASYNITLADIILYFLQIIARDEAGEGA